MMKKETESTETGLFMLKVKGCSTLASCYDEMRTLCEDLESCSQLRPTDQQR